MKKIVRTTDLRLPLVFDYCEATVGYDVELGPKKVMRYRLQDGSDRDWKFQTSKDKFVHISDFVMYIPPPCFSELIETQSTVSHNAATRAARIDQTWAQLDHFMAHVRQPVMTAVTDTPNPHIDRLTSGGDTLAYNKFTDDLYDAITCNGAKPFGVDTPIYVHTIFPRVVTRWRWEEVIAIVQFYYDNCKARIQAISEYIGKINKKMDTWTDLAHDSFKNVSFPAYITLQSGIPPTATISPLDLITVFDIVVDEDKLANAIANLARDPENPAIVGGKTNAFIVGTLRYYDKYSKTMKKQSYLFKEMSVYMYQVHTVLDQLKSQQFAYAW